MELRWRMELRAHSSLTNIDIEVHELGTEHLPGLALRPDK